MKADLLLITTLDVDGRQNNREHHVIAGLRDAFARVTVVYRARGRAGQGLGTMLRGQTRRFTRDGVAYVAVDPPLNPPEGAMRNLTAVNRGANSAMGRGAPSLRRRAIGPVVRHAIDSAAIARDLATIRALARAADAALAVHGTAPRETVCEAFGPWAARAARQLCRAGRLGQFVYVDRDFEPGFMASPLRRAWAARAERRAARHAALTLSIGRRLAARLASVPGADVRLSPTGIDMAQFARLPARPHAAPRPDLVFIGQIAPWSGIEEMLAAMALLAGEMPDCRLALYGPADHAYRAVIEARIRDLGLTAAVSWPGECPRAQVIAALGRASVGLASFRAHPLRIHAAPLKLLEYMAAGLPVIALEGSETGDMVTRTGTGLCCATTPAGIAAALRAWWRSTARRRCA